MTTNEKFGFDVAKIPEGSSPNPARAIWLAQHACVTESRLDSDWGALLEDEEMEKKIIQNQLGESGKKGHYSVLRFAHFSFAVNGFPHSTAMQLRTHYSSGISMLVSSLRYTGQRFIDVAEGKIPVDSVFYFRPAGIYRDREGKNFDYTPEARKFDIRTSPAYASCLAYKRRLESGMPREQARGVLSSEFIQPFVICGDLRSWFHLLDNRTLKDAQLECQLFGDLVLEEMKGSIPNLVKWYKETRQGKNKLAP